MPKSDSDLEKKQTLKKQTLLKEHDPQAFWTRACIFFAILALGLFAWGVFERMYKPIPHYYAILNQETGPKPIPMVALNQPNLTTEAVLRWAINAATASMTLNFNNYKEVIKNAKQYFTPAGYDNFRSAMERSKNLQDIVKKQLAVYAVATGAPVILMEGPTSNGKYAWQIQFPMLITYESESVTKQNIMLTLLISRIPTSESVTGIGIASFKVQEAKARTGP